MTVVTDALNAIVKLLDSCPLPDGDDFVSHPFYSTVTFRPEYPLATVDVPTVALSLAGGTNERKGLGRRERWHGTRLQLDILASTALEARRIFEKVWEGLLHDMNGAGTGAEGTYGKRYLYGQGIKELRLGEPNTTIWDEEGRIARIIADMSVEFSD